MMTNKTIFLKAASAGTQLCRGLTKEKVPGLGVCMCQCPSPTPPAPGHGAVAPFQTTHMRIQYHKYVMQ
jgi:hypothetical protein